MVIITGILTGVLAIAQPELADILAVSLVVAKGDDWIGALLVSTGADFLSDDVILVEDNEDALVDTLLLFAALTVVGT